MILPKEKKSVPLIDSGRCSGCGRCVAACPLRLITLETTGYRKHAVITAYEYCNLCLSCVKSCPITAITVIADSPVVPD